MATIIGEIIKNTYEEHIEWKIANFFSAIEEKKHYNYSPDFSFSDVKYVILWPKSPSNTDYLSLYLSSQGPRYYTVKYNFGLKNVNGNVELLFSGILETQHKLSDRCEIIKISELYRRHSELVPSNELTIMCILSRVATNFTAPSTSEEPKLKYPRSLKALSENFRNLLNDKESCDVILIVKERKFKAHKIVLIARSSVFAGIFRRTIAEKQTSVINIEECDPDAFQEFLEYLYSGEIKNISFSNVFQLYIISDKYNVKDLRIFCVDYLTRCLTTNNVCEVVKMAHKYDDMRLFSAIQNFFNKHSSIIFDTPEWEHLLQNRWNLANKLLKGMAAK